MQIGLFKRLTERHRLHSFIFDSRVPFGKYKQSLASADCFIAIIIIKGLLGLVDCV